MGGITNKQKFVHSLDSRHALIFAHIYDMAINHDRYSSALYGDFLSETSQGELSMRSNLLPHSPILFGGYEDAERKMIAFVPEYEDPLFPICAVEVISPNIKKLSHRDFLGSIIGLGIKREKCGDIIINDDSCFIILHRDIATFVANELKKVGREGVKAHLCQLSDIKIPQKTFTEVSGTVSSLRLDAVVSLFTGKGRSKASELVSGGLVFVNGLSTQKNDMHLSDGDVISVRGKGRATLNVGGKSKKDRIFITLVQ